MKNLFEVLKSWERQGKPEGAQYSYVPRFMNKEDVCGPFPIEELLDEDVVSLFVEFEKTDYVYPNEIWVEGSYSIAIMNLFLGYEVECQHLKADGILWQIPDNILIKDIQHYKWRWKDKTGVFNTDEWKDRVKKSKEYELER